MGLVGGAAALYFASFVLRALGWQKLFPAATRPARARCLAACGAAAASGVVLPFRLDYLVKIGTLRRMRGVKLGLEAIALSIISLGLVDAIAFLPLSISATAASVVQLPDPAAARRPLRRRVVRRPRRRPATSGVSPFIARRARLSSSPAGREPAARHACARRSAPGSSCSAAGRSRALGSTLLLAALGVGFSPTLALVVLCLSAAASLIPIASGGAVANVGATAAVLLALGVHKDQAINFGLASGLLLCGTAASAAIVGVATSFALGRRSRRRRPRLGGAPAPPRVRDNQAECSRGGLLWRSPPAR